MCDARDTRADGVVVHRFVSYTASYPQVTGSIQRGVSKKCQDAPMTDYKLSLSAKDCSAAEKAAWTAGQLVKEPGFLTTAVHPGQCPTLNTIFLFWGMDGKQIPMENPHATPWALFRTDSIWLCLDVVEHTTSAGEDLTFVGMVQVPRPTDAPEFSVPSQASWNGMVKAFYAQVGSVPWSDRGRDVMPVPPLMLDLETRCGAYHPHDVGAEPYWATDGDDFVLGSAAGVLNRSLGLVSVLYDSTHSVQLRKAAEETIRAAVTYIAADTDGNDVPGEVVALRESLLVGHLKGHTLAKNPVSAHWKDALASFSTWADQDNGAAASIDPFIAAALRGSRHGLPTSAVNERWVPAEREWITKTIGWALGFDGDSWQTERSDLNGGQ